MYVLIILKKQINTITSKVRTWCPYCCHNPKLCDDNKCTYCFNKSFTSFTDITLKGNLKIDCWDYEMNGDKIPRDVSMFANSRYWFICDFCNHSFKILISSITNKYTWCPYCKNKTELKFKSWFIKMYPEYNIECQKRYNWCKNIKTNRHLSFNFVIEKLQLIIEIDGEQHFSQISNWISPEKYFELDKLKMEKAIEYPFSIIRILQNDIFF